MNFKGYREVNIPELNVKMLDAFGKSTLSKVDIASQIKTSSQSIDNAFVTYISDTEGVRFKASDRLLCQVAKVIGINLAIVETGTKQYFINSKK